MRNVALLLTRSATACNGLAEHDDDRLVASLALVLVPGDRRNGHDPGVWLENDPDLDPPELELDPVTAERDEAD